MAWLLLRLLLVACVAWWVGAAVTRAQLRRRAEEPSVPESFIGFVAPEMHRLPGAVVDLGEFENRAEEEL
ncbi:MAG: hypothetical protein HYU66_23430 [Armatimonadetes bacterium]|nr:hypothetical protein [Armatimonadota bacterium]